MTDANRGAAKFPLGEVYASPEAEKLIKPEDIDAALDRHAAGDWGSVSASEAVLNEHNLAEGSRVRSCHRDDSYNELVIITDLSEGVTTVELPYADF